MNLWQYLDARAERRQQLRELRVKHGATWTQRYKGPTERQGVTIGIFGMAGLMLAMARENPALWDVKLFEVVFQAVVLTGLLNMVAAFHFAANKSDEARALLDEKRVDNTGKLADAVVAAHKSNGGESGGSTNALGDPVADDPPAPTGAPGDPVHVVEEER